MIQNKFKSKFANRTPQPVPATESDTKPQSQSQVPLRGVPTTASRFSSKPPPVTFRKSAFGARSAKQTDDQSTTTKLRAMLDRATKAVQCDSKCQRKRTLGELEQKYLNAKTLADSSPLQLEIAEREYLSYRDGPDNYKEVLRGRFNKEAGEIVQALRTEMNANSQEVISIIKKLDAVEKETKKQFADSIQRARNISPVTRAEPFTPMIDQPNLVAKMGPQEIGQIQISTQGDSVTKARRVEYQMDNVRFSIRTYSILWYIYYFLVLIYTLATIASPTWYRVFIVITGMFYPFFIDPFIAWLYSVWIMIAQNLPFVLTSGASDVGQIDFTD